MSEQTTKTHNLLKGKIPEETLAHLIAARKEFHKSIEGVLPPGFTEHHRNTHKEILLAWRSMIDASLARMAEPKNKD
jgi:hypothetical protein